MSFFDNPIVGQVISLTNAFTTGIARSFPLIMNMATLLKALPSILSIAFTSHTMATPVRCLCSTQTAASYGPWAKCTTPALQAKGHGISFREDGGEEFLYLAPADSEISLTKMSLTGEVVWVKNRETIDNDSHELLSVIGRFKTSH